MDALRELEKIQKQIDKAKSDMDILAGRKQEKLQYLKDEFGLDSIKEAESYIVTMTKQIEKEQEKIQEEFNKLQEEFEWA